MPPPPQTDRPSPRLALLVATGFGLGYLPVAPGTWGSLGSLALYLLLKWLVPSATFLATHLGVTVALALGGVWAADRAARHFQQRDPGQVVIDEISGQQIVFLGLGPVGWKYLLAGFLLFRAFDIWKPFPLRRVESWPGGWGIMADDWLAGVYAAVILWAARFFGW